MTEAWVKKGTEVASVATGQLNRVEFSKINRVGKRWLFLDNGEQFHVLALDRQEGVAGARTLYKLYKADDPAVAAAKINVEVRRVMHEASKAAEEFIKDPSVMNAKKAIVALLPYTSWALTDDLDSKPTA